MTYYHTKIFEKAGFEKVLDRTKSSLKEEGFGIITEIDMQATLKKKLDADFYPYVILGACNPVLAHKALQKENKIGTMLPCNVIVQQRIADQVEVAVINPVVSMQSVKNNELVSIAQEVDEKLKRALNHL